MFLIYAKDGQVFSSEEKAWSELSTRIEQRGATYDILTFPATELCISQGPNLPWHRLRAPTTAGVQFFHYLRHRVNLISGEAQSLYIAGGYFLPHGERLVLEVGPGWSTVRVELGDVQW